MMAERSLISLTYDGTQLCHLETVVPQLEDAGLRGTFFAEPTEVMEAYADWAMVFGMGHEVGNGGLIGSALPDGSLPAWTVEMVREDLEEGNMLLDELFGANPRRFLGLPWGSSVCGDGVDYLSAVAADFYGVRTGEMGTNQLVDPDMGALKCLPMAGLTGPQMGETVRQICRVGGWGILAFDGVGSGERSVDASAHADLLEFLIMNRDRIEVVTLGEAGDRLGGVRKGHLKIL